MIIQRHSKEINAKYIVHGNEIYRVASLHKLRWLAPAVVGVANTGNRVCTAYLWLLKIKIRVAHFLRVLEGAVLPLKWWGLVNFTDYNLQL